MDGVFTAHNDFSDASAALCILSGLGALREPKDIANWLFCNATVIMPLA
jgi:hypothetical protein